MKYQDNNSIKITESNQESQELISNENKMKVNSIENINDSTHKLNFDNNNTILVPNYPGRPKDLIIVAPGKVKRRGTGSLEGKQAFVHSICHMESYAIDISWDIIARYILFREDEYINNINNNIENESIKENNIDTVQDEMLPRSFFEDWLIVAEDEARHFGWLCNRLKELGSFYGDLPVHEGLWESCFTTRNSLLARLCILHCVHEARGLDVVPNRIQQLEDSKDYETCVVFKNIVKEEVDHVRKGVKWFQYLCDEVYKIDSSSTFNDIVQKYFRGNLKPPFNETLRSEAGMPTKWYFQE